MLKRTQVSSYSAPLVGLVIISLVLWHANSPSIGHRSQSAEIAPAISLDAETRIIAFCGDCHAMPRPESFPRDRWHKSVRKGYEHYARSGRSDLKPPPIHVAVDYFRSHAPSRLQFPVAKKGPQVAAARFTVQKVDWPRNHRVWPAISHLKWAKLHPDREPVLLVCDMRDGTVAALDIRRSGVNRQVLARLEHPCHVEVCDLEGNGRLSLVIADLGSFQATDHDRGRVVWLRPREDDEGFDPPIVLASGLGRIADVRPVDFDGDGRLDLLVAEFGHQQTGGIWLLRNVAESDGGQAVFVRQQIDRRPGTIHLLPHDFTGDRRIDFAALVSQHDESLELFINQGSARFRRVPVWRGPDLTFGSSGISLADLNGDGQMDILYTNGDTFDNAYTNPAHGVQWLENLGDLQFAYHRLTDLPGAYNARAADFDSNGRLDVIATAWLSRQVLPADLRTAPLSSLVLLSQTPTGDFQRQTLERSFPRYGALEVADFDGDGAPDFVVGLQVGPHDAEAENMAPITIWWNER